MWLFWIMDKSQKRGSFIAQKIVSLLMLTHCWPMLYRIEPYLTYGLQTSFRDECLWGLC